MKANFEDVGKDKVGVNKQEIYTSGSAPREEEKSSLLTYEYS